MSLVKLELKQEHVYVMTEIVQQLILLFCLKLQVVTKETVVSYLNFLKGWFPKNISGDACTTNQNDCHADADCSPTNSNAEGFTCACKNGYSNTPHKDDGKMCYDKRKGLLKKKSC